MLTIHLSTGSRVDIANPSDTDLAILATITRDGGTIRFNTEYGYQVVAGRHIAHYVVVSE